MSEGIYGDTTAIYDRYPASVRTPTGEVAGRVRAVLTATRLVAITDQGAVLIDEPVSGYTPSSRTQLYLAVATPKGEFAVRGEAGCGCGSAAKQMSLANIFALADAAKVSA